MLFIRLFLIYNKQYKKRASYAVVVQYVWVVRVGRFSSMCLLIVFSFLS